MSRIAVVGAGISGLACAWLLSQRHEVVLFESGRQAGGHAHTVDVSVGGTTCPVDAGFLVYNEASYPNLARLFATLGVESVAAERSFSVRIGDGALEWSDAGLAGVFAQPANLASPRFLRMLADLLRFNREAGALARSGTPVAGSLGEFLDARGYGRELRELYLVPMAASAWSAPASRIYRFPMATFLRFFANHGLLSFSERPRWRAVKGGAREYVGRLAATLRELRLSSRVQQLRRFAGHVEVATERGAERFDEAVLATHADQTLALLEHPSEEERAVLKAVPYVANRAVLHTDESLLPRRRRAWASWNFHAPRPELSEEPVAITYLLNRLQPLPVATPVMLSMNPVQAPREERILGGFEYHHPVFLEGSEAAQRRLGPLQGLNRTWYCGAWTRHGFHEDGLVSALAVARRLGAEVPWTA